MTVAWDNVTRTAYEFATGEPNRALTTQPA
jgi:hypothetical protein